MTECAKISPPASSRGEEGPPSPQGQEAGPPRGERLAGDVHLVERLLAAAPFGVLLVDGQGRIRLASPEVETLFGWSPEALVGRSVEELVPEEARTAHARARAAYVAGGAVRRPMGSALGLECLHRDGSLRPVEIGLAPVEVEGERLVMAVVRDLRPRRALEGALARAQRLETVGQLAAGLAHEINTPAQFVGDNLRFLADAFQDLLRAVGAQEALLAHLLPGADPGDGELSSGKETLASLRAEMDLDFLREEVPAALEQCLEGVRRIADIVLATRRFAHRGGGKAPEPVDLRRVARDAATLTRGEWKDLTEPELELGPGDAEVRGHSGELGQVLVNLVVNATHAVRAACAADGGRTPRIRLRVTPGPGSVSLQVSDNGTGLGEELQERIFEPLFTTKAEGVGTGLGLSIAREVVEAHGGSILCTSRPGEGCTFTVELPRESPAPGSPGRTGGGGAAQDPGKVA